MSTTPRIDRRHFLCAAAAAGGVLAVPRWLRADESRASVRRTLVLLHLVGGNDGLNTVVPHRDPRYGRLRPTLSLGRGDLVRLSEGLALHPSLAPLEPAFRAGTLAIVNGVGYPNPDYSHFRATEIWYSGDPERPPRHGWVGRSLDAAPRASALRAAALAKELPLSLHSETPVAATITDFSRFRRPDGLAEVEALYLDAAREAGALGEVGRAGRQALEVARRIERLAPAEGPYPHGPLGRDLARVVALLGADLDLEAVALGFGGFDTHANQAGQHAQLLGALAANLAVFQRELERRGLAERAVTVVFSEFGRRPEENASGGTDHGSAGPVFVLGAGVQGGAHGAHPSLDDLDDGNLRFTTDFRRVYAALAEEALGVDPRVVLGDFAPLEIFR